MPTYGKNIDRCPAFSVAPACRVLDKSISFFSDANRDMTAVSRTNYILETAESGVGGSLSGTLTPRKTLRLQAILSTGQAIYDIAHQPAGILSTHPISMDSCGRDDLERYPTGRAHHDGYPWK